jgi:hypothetical protein
MLLKVSIAIGLVILVSLPWFISRKGPAGPDGLGGSDGGGMGGDSWGSHDHGGHDGGHGGGDGGGSH